MPRRTALGGPRFHCAVRRRHAGPRWDGAAGAGRTILLWAEQGYRPVLPSVAKSTASMFPKLNLFTIDSLGGWTKVDNQFFTAPNGSVIKIEEKAGVPTASS